MSITVISAGTVLGTFPTDSVVLLYGHLRTPEMENYDMGTWTKRVSSATGASTLIAKLVHKIGYKDIICYLYGISLS